MKKNNSSIFTCLWIILVCVFLYTALASCFDQKEEDYFLQNSDSKKIIKSVGSNKIEYKIEDGNGTIMYSWTFNKENSAETAESLSIEEQIDFNIDTDVINPSINKLIETTDKLIVSFSHHGDLPSNSIIELNVSNDFENGDKLYLYYFNEKENKIEFIDDNILVSDGYLDFEIMHCSDYILSEEKIETAENNPTSAKKYLFYGIILFAILVAIKKILFSGK